MLNDIAFQRINLMASLLTDQAIETRKEAQAEIVNKLLAEPALSESTRAELQRYFGGNND